MRKNTLSVIAMVLSLIAIGLSAAALTGKDKTAIFAEGGARIEADNAAGLIRFFIDGQERAALDADGLRLNGSMEYTGTLTDISDRRFKTGIRPLASQLDNIDRLRPVSFAMEGDPSDQTEFGLIAQEVEPLYPALVQTRTDGAKAVNYVGFIAPLITAVQDLHADNARLRDRIEVLEHARAAQPPAPGTP
jgi:hypothetical protein